MDFLNPKKRRSHRIKLFIGYGLMGVALIFATILLLNATYGYHVDPKTGRVVQNGLVFVSADPVAAEVLLNGESHDFTDQRLDIPAGDYHLELRAAGYRPWSRDFTLEGGSIERFQYPFLFPEKLDDRTDAQIYATRPGMVTASNDRRWLLAQQPGSFESFDLIDMTVETPTAITLSMPSGLMVTDGDRHRLTAMEWSSDNRRVLLQHNYENGQEFVIFDIESPGASVNITNELEARFTWVALRDKKFDRYYLYDAATNAVATASLEDPQAVPYLKDVIAFKSHGNDVMAFITPTGADKGKVWLKIREGGEIYNVRQLSLAKTYLIDIARFDGSWYVAAGVPGDKGVYVFKDPVAAVKRDKDHLPPTKAVLRTVGDTLAVSFSANARFIAAQSGAEFAVFDAETDRQYRYNTGLKIPAGKKAVWMDGHRLSVVADSHVVVFDYDGTNSQKLSAAYNGTEPIFNRDYEALFTLAPSVSVKNRPAITRTGLRVE